MSPEQQKICIAEACGWRTELWTAGGWACYSPSGERQGFAGTSEASMLLHAPDFLHDLNAMHEAEETLNAHQSIAYIDELFKVRHGGSFNGKWQNIVLATAAQRAEAFLRTTGKWDDAR